MIEQRKKFDTEHASNIKLQQQLETYETRLREMQLEHSAEAATVRERTREKQLKTLEGRLDHTLVRFHEAETTIKKQQLQIDALTREKANFEATYTAIQRKYEKKCKDFNDLEERLRFVYVAARATRGEGDGPESYRNQSPWFHHGCGLFLSIFCPCV